MGLDLAPGQVALRWLGQSSFIVRQNRWAAYVDLIGQKLRTRSGAKIDSATANVLTTEAERGYDLSKAKPRRVGRPSLGERGASPRVSFRATPELCRAAKRRARVEGRSVSELAREAVARYVDS